MLKKQKENSGLLAPVGGAVGKVEGMEQRL